MYNDDTMEGDWAFSLSGTQSPYALLATFAKIVYNTGKGAANLGQGYCASKSAKLK